MSERNIRASEVGQYTFCPRAWWFANVVGVASPDQAALLRGTRVHRRHGRLVWGGRLLLAGAALVLLLALVALILALLGG